MGGLGGGTTTTTFNPLGGIDMASLFGKRKKRDLGALLAELGGGGGTTTADPCGLGGGLGGGTTTTTFNPLGGIDMASLFGKRKKRDLGALLAGIGGGGGTTTANPC